MAPETDPLSLRLGDCREGVEAHMAKHGLSIRGAVRDLIRIGLAHEHLDDGKGREPQPAQKAPRAPSAAVTQTRRIKGFDPVTRAPIYED